MLALPYRTTLALRAVLQFVSCALLLCSAGSAAAQDKDVIAAATAFSQAQQAELSGNNERAAELFELADRIAPTPEALRSATRARLAANQLVSAAGNAEELLRRYPDDAASHELAESVLVKARPELARFTFQCSDPCNVVVDGFAASTQSLMTQVVYVSPGAHELRIGFEGDAARELRLSGTAGEGRTVKVVRPPPRAPNPQEVASAADAAETKAQRSGRARFSPTYFWLAAGATLVAGAVTIWSGIDLIHARNDFQHNPHPTHAEFHSGQNKDLRTSVLIGATSALAVGTAVLAVFTDFKGSERQTASVSSDGHGAQLLYGGTF